MHTFALLMHMYRFKGCHLFHGKALDEPLVLGLSYFKILSTALLLEVYLQAVFVAYGNSNSKLIAFC